MSEGKIRFNTIFVSSKSPKSPKIQELKVWCEKFQKRGLTPKFQGNYTGNLSFRFKNGFIIIASGLESKENLTNNSFIYVRSYNKTTNSFYVEGKMNPSSESLIHYLIYKTRNNINAVFHGHNDLLLKNAQKLNIQTTKNEYKSGTIDLAKEVVKCLEQNKILVIKNHGFISVDKNMESAGRNVFSILRQID